MLADTHKGWLIEENWLHGWEATHPGFDGPEDNRYVTGKTRVEVIAEIDEWFEENTPTSETDQLGGVAV